MYMQKRRRELDFPCLFGFPLLWHLVSTLLVSDPIICGGAARSKGSAFRLALS